MLILRVVNWSVLLLGMLVSVLFMSAGAASVPEWFMSAMMGVFFAALLARLTWALVRSPGRRLAFGALLLGVLSWGTASVLLQFSATSTTGHLTFPHPSEVLFLSSYLFFAAFLFLDAASSKVMVSSVLDALILVGSIAAVSSLVLLTPFVSEFPGGGLPLALAVLYPVLNLALAIVVLAQFALGSRPPSRRTLGLALAFILLGTAEASLALSASAGVYSFSWILYLLWGAAFALLADSALAPRTVTSFIPRPVPEGLLLAGFLVSIALLVAQPDGLIGLVVAVPAAITLAAAAARLVMALRSARKAKDAFHLASTDDLTDLPNRRALVSRLDELLALGTPTGLLLLDLDGFKDVNDTLGHAAGDELLQVLATRMYQVVPSSFLLARLGGDEFAILGESSDVLGLLELAASVREVVGVAVPLCGEQVAVAASVGVALSIDGDSQARDLLRRADVAMYEAKRSGVGIQVYDKGSDLFSRQRLRLAEELRRALDSGQFEVWYQPKVSVATSRIASLEALVRWNHPKDGLVAPALFLSLARRSGLMMELSKLVARTAVSDLARWRSMGFDVTVAVNVSPTELLGERFVPYVIAQADAAGVPVSSLILEVTEDAFLAEPAKARQVLTAASEAGFSISVDDYGTGFSSLSYLQDLPVDELKLDRSFVSQVCSSQKSELIVASTVSLAHALELSVVAEGVESEEVADAVMRLGVDYLQGYLLSRPVPVSQATRLLKEAALIPGASGA